MNFSHLQELYDARQKQFIADEKIEKQKEHERAVANILVMLQTDHETLWQQYFEPMRPTRFAWRDGLPKELQTSTWFVSSTGLTKNDVAKIEDAAHILELMCLVMEDNAYVSQTQAGTGPFYNIGFIMKEGTLAANLYYAYVKTKCGQEELICNRVKAYIDNIPMEDWIEPINRGIKYSSNIISCLLPENVLSINMEKFVEHYHTHMATEGYPLYTDGGDTYVYFTPKKSNF